MGGALISTAIIISVVVLLLGGALYVAYIVYRNSLREAKNYERGLKMVPIYIHIPPPNDDLVANGRDERDITEEVLSQAQVMYNIISSTALKGFKSRIYGQRHISFEIVAYDGLVHYYALVPAAITDIVRQAIESVYPTVRLEETDEHNIFSEAGKSSGVIGGEFTLKKDYVYPIATYKDSKQDPARALLNALSSATKSDGAAIQFMFRPAASSWTKNSASAVSRIKKDKGAKSNNPLDLFMPANMLEALWKPMEAKEAKPDEKQLTNLEQQIVDTIEEKTRYPGFEVLIRVVVSSNTTADSQKLLKNIVAAFSLFDSPTNNGFKFTTSNDIDQLVTAYIFRFFPQSVNKNILNSVEMSTLFHLPDQNDIPTSQVKRQSTKQVDGPTELMEDGLLLGYNEFRGTKKQIRLSDNDRRRHTYFIGQTGTGKSTLLENLAYQDIMNGDGFAFVDPHGDSAEKLLGMIPRERIEDVVYFSPADMENPIGLNLFEFNSEDQKDFLIQETINMLYELYDPNRQGFIGARFETIFRNSALLLMSDPHGGTFIDIPKLLVDPDFVKQKLQYVTDPTLLDYWTKEWPNAQRSNEAGEVTSWVASKFGAFLSNVMMRNIIGQEKSAFNIRQIMDDKKILIVNLSKGLTGELNSRLLGMIFVMKFQAAAMSRADLPENERNDFCLYVDEFQNFATDSFATILSEARKYHLNLILANQFISQLTDKIREAVLGNIGTIISGRLGVNDAELLQKKFAPTFDIEDLKNLPNLKTIASVLINGVPSSAFSMTLPPFLAPPDPQLAEAVKKLSAAKYGRPRANVEQEIVQRLKVAAPAAQQTGSPMPNLTATNNSSGSSFLDDWLAKRQQIKANKPQVDSQDNQAASETVANSSSVSIAQPQADIDALHVRKSDNEDQTVSIQIR